MKKRWAWEGYVLWSRPKLCKILLYQWHTLCCLSKLKKLPYLYCIYCSFADKIYCLTGLNIFIFFKVHILFELFELVQKNMQKKTHSYFIRKLVHTESKCWNKRVNLSYCNLLCQSNKSKTLFVYVFIGLLLSVGLAFVWPYSRIGNQISLSSFLPVSKIKVNLVNLFSKSLLFSFPKLRLFIEQIHFPGSK